MHTYDDPSPDRPRVLTRRELVVLLGAAGASVLTGCGRDSNGLGDALRCGDRPGSVPNPAWTEARVSNFGWGLRAKDQPMTLRHLANMVSGYTRAEAPGTRWSYNDYGIKLLVETMKRVFGGGSNAIRDAADNCLGALDWQAGSGFSSAARDGGGISLPPRDMARYGLFWLNRGRWNGTQLLPDAWFNEFGVTVVPNDAPRSTGLDASGDYLAIGSYGGDSDQTSHGPGIYSWALWKNGLVGTTGNRAYPHVPLDFIMADGHFGGEVMVVIPSLGLVVAAAGTWGSSRTAGDGSSTFNMNLKRLSDAVTGTPSYPPTFPASNWATASDADAGLDTHTLNGFINAVGGAGVIIRHGRLVRTWGGETTSVEWASAAKPVLVCLLAMAGFEGLF